MANYDHLPVTADVAGYMKMSMLRRDYSSFSTWPYLLLSTILDPRFKCLGFQSDETACKAKACLRNEILKVIKKKYITK